MKLYLLFSTKLCNIINLGVKENTHGLGYSGLDPRKALPSTHVNLFELPPVRKGATSRKGIRGQVGNCVINWGVENKFYSLLQEKSENKRIM